MIDTEIINKLRETYPDIEKYLMYASRCKEEKKYCTEADHIVKICTKVRSILNLFFQ